MHSEPICAACGRPVSVCTADPEGCAPVGEPSKEALEEARQACWRPEATLLDRVAAALQRHMDAAEFYRGMADGRKVRMAALIAEVREAVDEDVFAHLSIDPDTIYGILAKYEDKP